MRPRHPIPILSFAFFLACGPIAPLSDVGSTSDATTTAPSTTTTPATSTPPNPTTTSTPDETTHLPDPTTGSDTTIHPDFIVTPDGGTGTLHCDIWTQNCPPGQKCVPYNEGGGGSWNSLKCVDITGDGAPGDPCTAQGGGISGIDDCDLGIMCWNVDERGHGTCVEQCSGGPESPMCPAFTSCSITGEGIINLCLPGCNPLLQDCPGDDLCIPNGDTFLCVLDASGEDGQVNDPCEFANSCDKGLLCLDPVTASAACEQGSQGCCQPFCELPDTPCPNPDQQCTPWFDPMMPIPPGLENLGICSIPQ